MTIESQYSLEQTRHKIMVMVENMELKLRSLNKGCSQIYLYQTVRSVGAIDLCVVTKPLCWISTLLAPTTGKSVGRKGLESGEKLQSQFTADGGTFASKIQIIPLGDPTGSSCALECCSAGWRSTECPCSACSLLSSWAALQAALSAELCPPLLA